MEGGGCGVAIVDILTKDRPKKLVECVTMNFINRIRKANSPTRQYFMVGKDFSGSFGDVKCKNADYALATMRVGLAKE